MKVIIGRDYREISEKAETVYRALKGRITPDVPASIPQLHQDVVVLLDKAANRILEAL
ncbi:MAG TPA: hypothetical protein VEG39_02850 [Clostridia bacterium]|nr:hypothetical protein [Clostridia bacterium]